MGIRRACTYTAVFTLPKAASTYSKILVTIQQNKQNLVSKAKSALTVSGSTVTLNLTQAETAQFVAGDPAWLQVRCYASATDAPGSRCWMLDVWPALDDQILS